MSHPVAEAEAREAERARLLDMDWPSLAKLAWDHLLLEFDEVTYEPDAPEPDVSPKEGAE